MMVAATALVLTIRLYGPGTLPPDDARALRAGASAILADAGIATAWVDCSRPGIPEGPCAVPLAHTEVALRILNAQGDLGRPLGQAVVDDKAPSSLATLFVNRIAATADAEGIDRGALLGRTAAHEIGHLMLGDNHGAIGVMQRVWTPSVLRTPEAAWSFSPAEARRLRERLAGRAELPPGTYRAN